MSPDDQRWLDLRAEEHRASQPSERWAVWLLCSILIAWLALGTCIALAIRLVEVIRG